MTILTPANAFPNLAFPQHGSGQTQVKSFTYPGSVWPTVNPPPPSVLTHRNAFPNRTSLARNFDGTSNYIDLGASATLTQTVPCSISMWIYPTGFPGLSQLYMKIANNSSLFGILIGSPNIQIQCTPGTGFFTTLAPSLNVWQLVCMIADGSGNISVNLNSTQQSTTGFSMPAVSANSALGQDPFNLGRFFQGYMSDVAIWNTNLNSTQLASLVGGARANTVGANANLIGYWPITGASPEPDQSGSGFNGTLIGKTPGIAGGPPLLHPLVNDGLRFPQHLSGQTQVQDFLYPGAVQPQFIPPGPPPSAAILWAQSCM